MSQFEDSCQLEISRVYPEDEGEYSCVATNGGGTVSCSATLTLDGESALATRTGCVCPGGRGQAEVLPSPLSRGSSPEGRPGPFLHVCILKGLFYFKSVNKAASFRTNGQTGCRSCASAARLHQPHHHEEALHRPKARFHSAHQELLGSPRGGGPFPCMRVRPAQTRDELVSQPAAHSAHHKRGLSL